MHIAIIGCGEVGRCYAAALGSQTSHTLSLCDIHPSPAMHEVAERLQAPFYNAADLWLETADLVLVCVQGFAALEANRTVISCMRPGAILADTTTACPEHKRLAADDAQAHRIEFTDVAIMGLIASTGAHTPLLCAGHGSGPVAAVMQQVDAPVRILEGAAAGDAISLKLLRSIITKGLETLAVEALVAAEQRGVRRELCALLSDMDQVSIVEFIETLVRTHVVHAERRQHEMEDALTQLNQTGLPSFVLPGVIASFAHTQRQLAEHPLQAPSPSLQDALAWLMQSRGTGGT
jgi:3-hydroxyisobutyrate dehydrogenase